MSKVTCDNKVVILVRLGNLIDAYGYCSEVVLVGYCVLLTLWSLNRGGLIKR